MPAQRYRIDPATGLVHLRTEIGEEVGLPPEAVTQGTIGISNGYLYAHNQGIIPKRIGTASESSLLVYDNGSIELISGVRLNEVASVYSTTSQYMLAGEVTVLTTSGEERTINIERAPASRIGTTLLVRYGKDNQIEFYEAKAKFANLDEINAHVPGDWRFATAEEVSTRALIGYLKNNQVGAIRELIELGGIHTAEGDITDVSGLIRYIAKYGADSLVIKSRTQYQMVPTQELDS